MVDRWSMIHIFSLLAIGLIQVFLVRRLFNVQPGTHGMKTRT